MITMAVMTMTMDIQSTGSQFVILLSTFTPLLLSALLPGVGGSKIAARRALPDLLTTAELVHIDD
jgi:hypothetical protein